MNNIGMLSILPAAIAIILAFVTKDAIIALFAASLIGFLLIDGALWEYPNFLIETIANDSFAWVFYIEIQIGILIALFQLSDVPNIFSSIVKKRKMTRRKGQVYAWLAGMGVFFSDYFSPVFVGTSLQPITDKVKISREKLAYIADSTSAPLIVIIPFTSWALYIAGIISDQSETISSSDAVGIFASSIMYNFYAILSVLFVGLICFGVVKDFGPMKKAENRAFVEGKLVRDGSTPMIGKEIKELKKPQNASSNFVLNFFIPVALIIGINVATYILVGSAKIVESFSAALLYLFLIMIFQKFGIKELSNAVVSGVKAVIPAVLILLFAYALNSITKEAGAANYLVSISEGLISANLLPAIVFIVAAVISFSTGTSWGTFAITIPIALVMSIELTGSIQHTLVFMSIAAATGGGVFGDHCSPLSDTSVLASIGAGSDHMDHIRTQIPYALSVAFVSFIFYLAAGFIL
ncbi:Na+/H+ antiporter NhaC family protein [Halomonas sp. 86]|uniref:Na+/H+ antiporter NhaC family protein n=1 Tax=unclassified Halomonas TaxID=2609666 RepID=UPI004034D062